MQHAERMSDLNELDLNEIRGLAPSLYTEPVDPQRTALVIVDMQGSQASHEAIRMARTKRLVVTAEEGVLPAHADGETLCTDGRHLVMELLPKQIEIVCRQPEAA